MYVNSSSFLEVTEGKFHGSFCFDYLHRKYNRKAECNFLVNLNLVKGWCVCIQFVCCIIILIMCIQLQGKSSQFVLWNWSVCIHETCRIYCIYNDKKIYIYVNYEEGVVLQEYSCTFEFCHMCTFVLSSCIARQIPYFILFFLYFLSAQLLKKKKNGLKFRSFKVSPWKR